MKKHIRVFGKSAGSYSATGITLLVSFLLLPSCSTDGIPDDNLGDSNCATWENYDPVLGRCIRIEQELPDVPDIFGGNQEPDMQNTVTPDSKIDLRQQEEDASQQMTMEDMVSRVDTTKDLQVMMPPEDMNMSMPDMPQDMTPSCQREMRRYGEPCTCADQCASRMCLNNPLTQTATCTQTCGNRLQCNNGIDQCVNLGATKVCVRDDTGAVCDGGPHLCSTQICVESVTTLAPQKTFCSVFCDSASDCLPNHVCSPAVCNDVSGDPNVPLLQCILTIVPFLSPQKEQLLSRYEKTARICVPVMQSNACQTDDDPGRCLTGLCDDDPTVCTGQCLQPLDCPHGTCQSYDVSDSRIPIGFCEF